MFVIALVLVLRWHDGGEAGVNFMCGEGASFVPDLGVEILVVAILVLNHNNLCIELEATDAKYDFCIVKWPGIEKPALVAILHFFHS